MTKHSENSVYKSSQSDYNNSLKNNIFTQSVFSIESLVEGISQTRSPHLNGEKESLLTESFKNPDLIGTGGTNLKLLKACAFCRKRKIKCVVLKNSNTCENCIIRNKQCVFDHKFIHQKKKSNVSKRDSHKVCSIVNMHGYNKKTYIPIELSDFATSSEDYAIISSSKKTNNNEDTLLHMYKEKVFPYTPFLEPNILNHPETLDKFSKFCINVASVSSPSNKIPIGTFDLLLDVLKQYLLNEELIEWNGTTLSCFFLLPFRINISQHAVQGKLKRFNNYYTAIEIEKKEKVSINLIIGALLVDAYNALLSGSCLITSELNLESKLKEYLDKTSENSFNFHFISIGYLIYKYCLSFKDIGLDPKVKRIEMIRLEYDMLFWPVMLTRNLSVIEGNVLATSEVNLLHTLHNLLLTDFYFNAIVRKEVFGEMSAVFSVRGLYYFLADISKSIFRVNDKLVDRWSILANCQVHTAKLILSLNNFSEFEMYISALKYFKKHHLVDDIILRDTIYNQIAELVIKAGNIGNQDSDLDRANVYWIFRDIRSMSIQMYLYDIGKKK